MWLSWQEIGVEFRGLRRVALREIPVTTTLASRFYQDETVAVPKTDPHPIVYFHGGGFVAANACVLTQAVVPLARNGFCVYAADYPMGEVCGKTIKSFTYVCFTPTFLPHFQKHAFPLPILSGLKLLYHLRTERAITSCHLYVIGICVVIIIVHFSVPNSEISKHDCLVLAGMVTLPVLL